MQLLEILKNFFENALWAFTTITFIDVLDILLVAGLFFGVFIYMAHRRVAKLFEGLCISVAVLVIGNLIGMRMTTALGATLRSLWLIVLVVIFQEEFRDILMHIGRFPGYLRHRYTRSTKDPRISKELEKTVEEIVKATTAMAEEKVGALIVIERSERLGEYYAKGQKLDCEVSAPLIRTVFYNGSPLHDGAMVICNNRIKAASCQLPTTAPESLDTALGERHKAAIGISECTDCVVVVVSEESGTISIAQNCKMKRDYNKEDLTEELYRLLRNYSAELSSPGIRVPRRDSEGEPNLVGNLRSHLHFDKKHENADQNKENKGGSEK